MQTADVKSVWEEYTRALGFNASIGLNDTVENNENFFIGRQWEGVQANGLPTPVFNFLKRVVLFLVSSALDDSIKMQASPMNAAGLLSRDQEKRITDAVNMQFERLFEKNKINSLLRQAARNMAVDGDGCFYVYFDPDKPSGQFVPGDISVELIENTRVFFGNPNDRNASAQPWILISSRELVRGVARRAKKYKGDVDAIRADPDMEKNGQDAGEEKCTVLIKFWRADNGDIHAFECTRDGVVRRPWNTGLKLYPVTWASWDFVRDCYHGQAAVTGLIPNQIFVNKLFAMAMISLMTTAYPKVVYDKTRVEHWDNRVGAAIAVNGGDVHGVAAIIDPAQISPQISQFIDAAISYTKEFMGATDAALGSVDANNASAIVALQRATQTPLELVRANLQQFIEDMGSVFIDHMAAYYGVRMVDGKPFDFRVLRNTPMSLKLDVGAGSYWSEVASIQTLDNLLKTGKLELADYLMRLPEGIIPEKQALIDKLSRASQAAAGASVRTF